MSQQNIIGFPLNYPLGYLSVFSTPYATTTTILASDIVGGNLLFDPSASGQTFTLPTFTNMDATFGAVFGSPVPVGFTYDIMITNVNATDSCTIVQGTGFSITNGNITMATRSRGSYRVHKDTSSSYVLI